MCFKLWLGYLRVITDLPKSSIVGLVSRSLKTVNVSAILQDTQRRDRPDKRYAEYDEKEYKMN